jgi:phosphate uptake regulator
MLDYDYKMWDASRKTLREADDAELPFDIKSMDRKINKYEREVRRKVLTHLTIAGTQNLVPGLALVSIVIDVERIGDYTKNIAGLAKLNPPRLKGFKYEDSLQKIEATIENNFSKTVEVLRTQNKSKARTVLQVEEETGKAADAIVSDLIVDTGGKLTGSEAVALAMYARYLKRINAHLTNIASSIVNPFPRIGFREKKRKKKS